MSQRVKLSRREWLKGACALSGAAVGTRLAGPDLFGTAHAQGAKKSAVVSIYLVGGFNALFVSADSFLSKGSFSVSDAKIKDLGNGLKIDKETFGTFDAWTLGHMAAIGNRHGLIDHGGGQRTNFLNDKRSFPVQLAAAIGGSAAYKAVALGSLPLGGAPSEGTVSLQLLRTMGDVSTALGLGPIDYNRPARNLAGKAIDESRVMSQAALAKNRASMRAADDAYGTLVESLVSPPLAIDVASVAQAYNVSAGAGFDSVAAKLAGAELMIKGGTNVVTLADNASGWDTHGDGTGSTCRTKMQTILPAIKIFLGRLQTDPILKSMNISVMIHGEFARSLPIGDHAPVLTACVIGTNVKVGTTGKVSADVGLPAGTGASREMWSYLADLAKVQTNPFGPNPHPLVL